MQEGPRPVSSRRSRPVARGLEEPPTPRLGVLGPRWLQVLGLARLHGAPWRAQVRPPSLQVRPGSTRRIAAAHSQVPTGRISDELGEAGGGPGAWRILGLGPSLRSSAGRGRGLVRVQLRGRVGDPGDADERILSTGIRGHWVPSAQQGRWAAGGRGPGRGPGRSGCPRLCSARVTCRFSENALRPDARQSRGGRSGPGRRPAPATPAPVGRLRGCGFSGRLGTDLLEAGARGGACARRGGAGPGASGSRGSSTTWWPRGGSASGGSLEWHWWQARGAGDVSCGPHPAISPLGIVPEQTLTYSE